MRKIKSRYLIWAIPIAISAILILLHLIAFIYDYKMLNALYKLISANGYNDEVLFNLNKFIKTYDNQYLITGMEIVGIAISVWIGLNIYNVVKRDSIKELEYLAKETRAELESFRNNYQSYNLTALENAKLEEERINDYLVNALKEYGKNILDYNSTKNIVFIEKNIQLIIKYLKSENYYLVEKNLSSLEEKLIQLEKDINLAAVTQITKKEKETIENYINVRYGDYNYYLGLLYLGKNHEIKSNKKNAKHYLTIADKYYSHVVINDEQLVRTYINNVRGYICFLLFNIINEIGTSEEKSENYDNLKNALNHSINACTTSSGVPCETNYSRDHRNYGVNIENMLNNKEPTEQEWYTEMLNALDQYNIALKFDKNDTKTLTSISSCILKIFDKIINLTKDEEDQEELIRKLKGLKNINIKGEIETFISNNICFEEKIQIGLIQVAASRIVVAQLLKPNAVETHYHAIHIYMYLILSTDDDNIKQYYISKGIEEINNCNALYSIFGKKPDKAFLYKARNFYFSIGDDNNGNHYDSLIRE